MFSQGERGGKEKGEKGLTRVEAAQLSRLLPTDCAQRSYRV